MSENIIGFIAVCSDGLPYQPIIGNSYHARKKPITVYQRKDYAEKFTGNSIPVYTKDVNE